MFTVKRNFTSKDELTAIGALPLQNIKDKTVKIVGLAIDEREDNGRSIKVGYLKTDDEVIYTTISDTVIRGISALVDIMDDDNLEDVDVHIKTQLSNNKREFFLLEMV